MKHIRLFENFNDDAGQSARDIFGLTSEFVINYTQPYWGGEEEVEYCKVEGPSENSDEASKIVDKINHGIIKLADNKRSSDGKYIDSMDIDDLFYDEGYFKELENIGYYVYYWHSDKYGYIKADSVENQVKEGYQDEVGDSARDIFVLVHTIEVYDIFGSTGIAISGPSEESVKANTIVREIESEIHKRLPNPRSAPRFMWIETVNDIMKRRKSDLSEIGYKIDTWYNGAESPELSR